MQIEREIQFESDHVHKIQFMWGRESRPLWETLENLPASQCIKWVDRFSGLETLASEWSVAKILESTYQLTLPPRAEGLRTVHAEFNRLVWYFTFLSRIFEAISDRPRMEQALYLRELVFAASELFTGSRILPHLFSLGGLSRDLSMGESRKFLAILENVKKEYDFFFAHLREDRSLKARLTGVLRIPKKVCEFYYWTGVVGQASGLDSDLRIHRPYGLYNHLRVEPFSSSPDYRGEGDCWERLMASNFQIQQSLRLCGEAIRSLPEGDFQLAIEPKVLWPSTPAHAAIEGASGRFWATLVGQKIRLSSASTRVAPIMEDLLVGLYREDWRLGLASLGFELGEGDLGA